MTTEPLDLFYSYAHADATLRDKLDTHLTLLQREGLIRPWHDRAISPGTLWAAEIDHHLRTAHLVLLLVSPDFLASDYCYGIEMQEAMRRHQAGAARVIPILLRPCDWESAPFGQLQALPANAKAVTMWTNRDAAFTAIAKGLRTVITELRSTPQTVPAASSATFKKRQPKTGERIGGGTMSETPTTPTPADTTTTRATPAAHKLKDAINHYYKQLEEFKGKADYELALRSAFQNLLAETARLVNWTLIPEQTIEGNIRPDGVLRDTFDLRRGFWEAKGPKSDLDREIKKKIAAGYPLTNTIFENTQRAIIYQNKKRVPGEFDLRKPNDVIDLLNQFIHYTEPDIENFETAVVEFKERIPEFAEKALAIIENEHKVNKKFIVAFDTFATLCRASLDPQISTAVLKEMLVQHLLTERLFRTVFDNPDFINRNVIAVEIDKVIQALVSRSFRQEFLRPLDRFYVAIEGAAKGLDDWSERQHFLNTVYERFFQGFSVKQADTHGIVYTPQEIVDFMCASVDEVLKQEFGTSLAAPGVQILDPATGTGSFIVNILHRIPRQQLKHKYQHDLFCNEIMLLPYYIASLNIEHEYYTKIGEYEPFEGICFADTLELAEGQQLSLFVEENTERVKREKDAQIMVVIGNPPYNVGQRNENDNNKNRSYPVIDQRINKTYVKDSRATLNNKLYDQYVRFFRWASDRLNGPGIVCLVSNNSFVDQIAFDGMRKHLLKDFSKIYHLDLHGNVRKNPKLSGTTHNVFGIQVGVGITLAIKTPEQAEQKLYYYRVPDFWTKTEKLNFLAQRKDLTHIEWIELQPDEKNSWITEGIHPEFDSFLSMGTRETKRAIAHNESTIFKLYSLGIVTNRDSHAYSFDVLQLTKQVTTFVDIYNSAVDKLKRLGNKIDPLSLIDTTDPRIKWTRQVKASLNKYQYSEFVESHIRTGLYRPFTKKKLYFDDFWNEERYKQHLFFPTPATESENIAIIISDIGYRASWSTLVTNTIPDLHVLASVDAYQCFPYYTYAEDGSNRRENIIDWALKQFQGRYGPTITKWDIFHYVYAMLHHPQYRERYAENLKRDLPHIPLLRERAPFLACVRLGQQLMALHLNYEQAREYPLQWQYNESLPLDWRVQKMRLTADKTALLVNDSLTLAGLPPECFQYRLGNRSALEWLIDQYQVSHDKRSGIESDPNNIDDEEYIVRLVLKVVTVSVETVRLVNELTQSVTLADWLDEANG